MNDTYEHPRMKAVGGLALALYELAALTARSAARVAAPKRRGRESRRGSALAPGVGTPLWNELVAQALPHLTKRGSKANLARILSLPRQRLQDCLKARSACLDAERNLLLLCWFTSRHQGRE
ncbi:MAG: hypothetical protein IT582_05125, partial [Opitutaceae bacterium]|nr:hypothetical protein [Opitutaceae bacterium]